jgi:broad specificity phosphatase PhoE
MQALREIAEKHSGTVVVATHGGVIMAVLYHINVAGDVWQGGVQPGSITSLEFNQEIIKPLEIGLCLEGSGNSK